jgi:branched-chain amino acid transport system permease protein
MTDRKWKLAGAIILGILLLVVIPFSPRYIQTLAISIIIYSIYVCSSNLLTGYTGLVSLGQAMFWGSAAYLVAILTTRGIVQNFFLIFLIALLFVMVLSALFGMMAVRVKKSYFMILTFAFGHVVWSVAQYSLQNITYGVNGIRDVPRPNLGFLGSMESSSHFYFLTLVVAILCYLLIFFIIHSPFGHALMGIRDNEHRMSALGFNTFLYKVFSYVLSAMIAGVGGTLFAYFHTYVSPSDLHWIWSGEALMMMFIGGIGTFWGPLLGSLVYTALRYWVSAYTMYWFGVEGIIFILVVLFFRGGIVGFLTDLKRRGKPSRP